MSIPENIKSLKGADDDLKLKLKGANISQYHYIVKMLCDGEIVQYEAVICEEKTEGVVNKKLISEFNKL